MNSFNKAIDEENFDIAKSCYDEIDQMLHPESAMKKILKIQLIGLPAND